MRPLVAGVRRRAAATVDPSAAVAPGYLASIELVMNRAPRASVTFLA